MIKSEESYGSLFHTHLLEQYKLLVESTHKISVLRTSANLFFLSASTFLLGLMTSDQISGFVLPVLGFCGVLSCLVWGHLINTYKALNAAKFAVIHEIESNLPASAFKREWELFQGDQQPGESDDDKKKTLTSFEILAPWLFGVCFVVVVAAKVLVGELPCS